MDDKELSAIKEAAERGFGEAIYARILGHMIAKLVTAGMLSPQDVVEYVNASLLSLEKSKASNSFSDIAIDQARSRLAHMLNGYSN